MKSVRSRLLELQYILSHTPEDGLEYCNKWLAQVEKPLKKKECVSKVYTDKLRDVWFELSREKTDDKRSL